MMNRSLKILLAIAAAGMISACEKNQDFYRGDQQAPPSTTGFFMGAAPKTGRGATGAPPSTTSQAQVPPASEPAPAPAPASEAPPSTTSSANVPASAPAPVTSAEAPPSTTAATPPSSTN